MRGRKGLGRSSPVRCHRVIALRQFDYDASSAKSWYCSPWPDRLPPACRTRDAAVSHPADTIVVVLPPLGSRPPVLCRDACGVPELGHWVDLGF